MNTFLAIVISFWVSVSPFHPLLWNCEDRDVTSCYTFDEGQWRVVKSYDPYSYTAVKLCKAVKVHKRCLGPADKHNRRPLY